MHGWLVLLAGLQVGCLDVGAALPNRPNGVFSPECCSNAFDNLLPQEPLEEGFFIRIRDNAEVAFCLLIQQTETTRDYGLVSVSSLSLGHDCYLGNDLSVSIEAEVAVGKLSAPVSLSWYALQGIQFTIGYDLLRWRVVGSVSLRP